MLGSVEALLRVHGPCLSTDLAQRLMKRHGLTAAAARKRVSRPAANVRRLGYLTFPRNARFIYLQEQFGSPDYWSNLIRALLESGSAYGLALAALQQRNGIMPTEHFPIACGAPLRQKKHLAPEIILQRLRRAQLVDQYDIPGVGPCIALIQGAGRYDEGKHAIQARLVTEEILLKAIKSWLQRLGLSSYNKVAVREKSQPLPRVGTLAWDLTAPSYLEAFLIRTPSGKVKPGFIACDVLLGVLVDEVGLKPFVHKCAALRSLKNVGRCLQIFVADRYSSRAFDLAKVNRIVPATPETLFGNEVAEGLAKLFEVLRDAAHFALDPKVFAELFRRLASIEGAAVNLRGALFEYLVAEMARQLISQNVRLNYVFRSVSGAKAEADVVVEEANRRVTIIECKGYQPGGTIPDALVERWLSTKIPTMYEVAREHPDWRSLEIRFEFWTTGNLSEAARKLISDAQQSIRSTKFTIEVRDRDAIRSLAQKLRNRSLLETLEQHFLEHPLATMEDVARRRPVWPARSLARKEGDDPEFLVVLEESTPP